MDDIGNILSSLSDDDILKLKGLAGDLFGAKKESAKTDAPSPQTDISSTGIDAETISRITHIMGVIKDKSSNDDKENFIMSLKPLLSDKRQEKADEAVKMMHLLDLLPVLKETGIFNF